MFEKLFKRTKTGGVQEYSIDVAHDDTCSYILKDVGKLGGKLVRHVEKVEQGKQNRTVQEQAGFMATSDWKKKKDEGYKSLKDLGVIELGKDGNKMAYRYDGSISNDLFNILNSALATFNTDSNGNVKPMLANSFNPKKDKFPGFAQPKLDGVRCLMIIDFNTGEPEDRGPNITFLSRKGKEYSAVFNHIGKRLMCQLSWDIHPFDREGIKEFMLGDNKLILDGELYSSDISFQSIVSAVKAYNEDTPKIKFVMYDFVSNLKQKDRIQSLAKWKKLMERTHLDDIVKVLHTEEVSTLEEFHNLHNKWVAEGYEGAMFRNPDGIYGQGQRSSHLLKYKAFDETEFELLDFKLSVRASKTPEEESENSVGVVDLLAIIKIGEDDSCEVTMAGSSSYKRNLYLTWSENKGTKYKLTVKHFGYTETNRPRIATGKVIRDYE